MSEARPRFNPQLASLPVYVPGRPIDEVARELGLDPGGIIKLASNENPLGPSPRAVAAMEAAIRQVHLYPDGSSFHLRRRLAALFDLEPGQVVLGNGSNEILELIGHVLLSPGTDIVVSQYCFAVYPIVAALFGARLIEVPARSDLGADIPAMLRAITPSTRAVFLANPNNPTGTLSSREDVSRLLAGVPPEVMVVMDEAYIEFLADPVDLVPLLRAGTTPNLILTRTFSKVFGLAGLRLGYGLASPEVAAALEKARQPFNVNLPAQAAALAAIDDREHLARTRANNAEGLAYVQNAVAQMGRRYVPSHANFVLVHVGEGARVFAALQRRGIITRPMAGYGLPEWLRVSIGTTRENMAVVQALREELAAAG